MPCYAISIREDKQHLLKDNGGFLFFKKKSLALEVCDSMNTLRKGMKLDQVYSVCKIDEKDWKDYPIVYDQEFDNDTSTGNVSGYTKRAALHAGADGSLTDTKGSKGSKAKSKGSTEALPFGV
jgi:hypothetical protein